MLIRDRLDVLFEDEEFAGRCSPPARLRRPAARSTPTGPSSRTRTANVSCLIRRGRGAAVVVHQEVAATQVLEVINELGTTTAIRQFGGHAVSAALASATRTPMTSPGT